jgi:hypothetical protein
LTLAKAACGGNGQAAEKGTLSGLEGSDDPPTGLWRPANASSNGKSNWVAFAHVSPSIAFLMETTVADQKLESLALWILLMLLTMVPWVLE